jgi:hypothetical protein
VPVVSVAGLVALVKGLVDGTTECPTRLIAAVDSPVVEEGTVVPLATILRRFEKVLNGDGAPSGLGGSQQGAAPGAAAAWSCHLPFATSPVPGNLLTDVRSVWAEFLQKNALQPLSILVAGPPRVGKTDAVKLLAEQ